MFKVQSPPIVRQNFLERPNQGSLRQFSEFALTNINSVCHRDN